MKQATVLNGIGFAIIAGLCGGLLHAFLSLVFSALDSASTTISALSLAYTIYLLRCSRARQGKVVVMAFWLMINAVVYFTGPGLISHIAIQIAFIWAVRSLYFHSSITTVGLDLVLVVLSTGAGSWALLQTGSLIAAAWYFFLCQSLFCAIPHFRRDQENADATGTENDRFEAAHRVAQDAVRKLSLN